MSAGTAWLESPVVIRLGWTLLAFVWQGALIGVIAAGMLVALRRRTPQTRYATLLLLLTTAALCLPATFACLGGSSPVSPPITADETEKSLTPADFRTSATPQTETFTEEQTSTGSPGPVRLFRDITTPPQTAPSSLELPPSVLSAIVCVWLFGVLALTLRLARSWWSAQRLVTLGVQPLRNDWLAAGSQLAQQLGIRRRLRWLESTRIAVPLTVGWLRPVIIVPTAILTNLSPVEVECLLAHELAHVRRYDYLVNLLQSAVEVLLFYHPVVWWLSRRIRHERELICDQQAVDVIGDRVAYSKALVSLASLACRPAAPALAANGGALQSRISTLLGVPQRRARASGWMVVGLMGGILTAVAGIALLATGPQESDPQTTNGASADDGERSVVETFVEGDHKIGPITGRVRTANGKPVAAAAVWLRERTSRRQTSTEGSLQSLAQTADLARTTTDSDGNFRFENVPLPEDTGDNVWLDVVVLKAGLAIGWKHVDYPRESDAADVVLQSPRLISGLIVDQTGAPVADTEVRVNHLMSIRHVAQADLEQHRWPRIDDRRFVDLAWFRETPTTTTDANGRFTLDRLPPGLGVVLGVANPKYLLASAFSATVDELDAENAARAKRPVQTGELRVSLTPGHVLKVRVVLDDTGEPAAGARCVLPRNGTPSDKHIANSEGLVEFMHLGRPLNPLVVIPPSGSEYIGASADVTFADGESETAMTVRLKRGAIIAGRVVDAETGTGIADVEVAIHPQILPEHSRTPIFTRLRIRTAQDGSFRTAVPPGETLLLVNEVVPGYRTLTRDMAFYSGNSAPKASVETTADRPVEDVVIKLEPAPVVRGVVYDPDGRPAGGIAIHSRVSYFHTLPDFMSVRNTGFNPESSRNVFCRSDENGRFTVNDLYPLAGDDRTQDRNPILFLDPRRNLGAIVWPQPAESAVDQKIDVRLEKLGTVTGRIIDDDTDQPVAGTRVQLYQRHKPADGQGTGPLGGDMQVSARDGRFELSGVFDGANCSVTVSDGRFVRFGGREIRFVGRAGETHDVGDIRLVSKRDPKLVGGPVIRRPISTDETPTQTYERLIEEFDIRWKHYESAAKSAWKSGSELEKARVVARQEPTPGFVEAFENLAQDNRNTEVELRSLLWIVKAPTVGENANKVIPHKRTASKRLLEAYVDRPELAECVETVAWHAEQKPLEALGRLYRENPHREVKGLARYAEGRRLVDDHPSHDPFPENRRRAIAVFQDVIDNYADLPIPPPGRTDGTLGESAQRFLDELQNLTVGAVAPEITGRDVHGRPLKLSDFRGRAVVLVFWGSWCGPCLGDLPELNQLADEFGDRVAVVGVMSDTPEDAAQCVAENHVTFPNFVDGQGENDSADSVRIADQWNVRNWPTKYVIDADGVIRFKRVQTYDLRAAVELVLAGAARP